MAPALLFLVYREGKNCQQYPFETIESVEDWAKRKPYRDEPLRVHCCVDRQPIALVCCMGHQIGAELRQWFDVMFAVGLDNAKAK